MRRRGVALVVSVLLLGVTGCTGGGEDASAGSGASSAAEDATPSTARGSGGPSPAPVERGPVMRAEPPHPVSLPALMRRDDDGGELRRVRRTLVTDAYVQHAVTYRSGGLTITGLMNTPRSPGPHPALVLAHGYIDPAVYVTGQGLRREQDWLARQGYLTLHVDYRNHAGSDRDPTDDRRLRLGYTEDVVNAVLALRGRPAYVDGDRIGLVGRSMGGGVVYNALVVRPGLVDAAVVFAPVSSRAADNFERWIRPDEERSGLAGRIIRRYGAPERAPEFWRGVSPRTYFDRVRAPVMVHHGTSDDSVPIRWTRASVAALRRAGADVRLHVYPGEEHAFGPQWPLSMRRTTRFLDARLR